MSAFVNECLELSLESYYTRKSEEDLLSIGDNVGDEESESTSGLVEEEEYDDEREEPEATVGLIITHVNERESLLRALAVANGKSEDTYDIVRKLIVDELTANRENVYLTLFGITQDGLEDRIIEVESPGSWIPISCIAAFANAIGKGVVLHSRSEAECYDSSSPGRTFLPLTLVEMDVSALEFIHIAWSNDTTLSGFVAIHECPLILNDIYGLNKLGVEIQTKIEAELVKMGDLVYTGPVLRSPHTLDRLLDFIVPNRSGSGTALEGASERYIASQNLFASSAAISLDPDETFMCIPDDVSIEELLELWKVDSPEFGKVEDFMNFFPQILVDAPRSKSVNDYLDDLPIAGAMHTVFGDNILPVIDMLDRIHRRGLLPYGCMTRLKSTLKLREARGDNQDATKVTKLYASYMGRYFKMCKFYKTTSCLVTEERLLQFLRVEQQRPVINPTLKDAPKTFSGRSTGESTLTSAITAMVCLAKLQQCIFPGMETKVHTDLVKAEVELFRLRAERLKREQHFDRHSEVYDESISSDETSRRVVEFLLSQTGRPKPYRNAALVRLMEATASRGKWCRAVTLADTYFVEMGIEKIPVVGFLKYLQKGMGVKKSIAVGIARHKHVEICPVAMLSMHLFTTLQGDHSKIFPNRRSGFHNFEDWADVHWFYGSNPRKGLSPSAHLQMNKKALKELKIKSMNVTHMWKTMALHKMEDAGVDSGSANRMAGTCLDVSQKHYKRKKLPHLAIKTQAGFKKDEPYRLRRAALTPPDELLLAIFPNIEDELLAHEALIRCCEEVEGLGELTVPGFLNLMAYMRLILLQDSIRLRALFPNLDIWNMAPFNTRAYKVWYKEAIALLESMSDIDLEEMRKSQCLKEVVFALEKVHGELQVQTGLLNMIVDKVNFLVTRAQTQYGGSLKRKRSHQSNRRLAVAESDEELESCDNPIIEPLGKRSIQSIWDDNKIIIQTDSKNGGSAKWRSSPRLKTQVNKIRNVCRAIQTLVDRFGWSDERAIAEVENLRTLEAGKLSIFAFDKKLKDGDILLPGL